MRHWIKPHSPKVPRISNQIGLLGRSQALGHHWAVTGLVTQAGIIIRRYLPVVAGAVEGLIGKIPSNQWDSHVDLGIWADLFLIAPVTASTMGKMANGIADNLLLTTYLSCKAPVILAPAMDLDMYQHPSTVRNIQILQSYGNQVIEPGTGELASGLYGKGRMEEPEVILEKVQSFFAASSDDQK